MTRRRKKKKRNWLWGMTKAEAIELGRALAHLAEPLPSWKQLSTPLERYELFKWFRKDER